MAELIKIYENTYSIYEKQDMYCFIPKPGSPGELSLEESFLLGGSYLFCEPPERKEEFFEAAEAYLKRRNRRPQFVWLEHADTPVHRWKAYSLTWGESPYLEADTSLMMERYRLYFTKGLTLSCKDTGFYFQPQNGEEYGFSAPGGQWSGEFYLETEGSRCGAFCGKLKNIGEGMMDRLDAGLSFFTVSEEPQDKFRGFLKHAGNRLLDLEYPEDLEFQLAPHRLSDRHLSWFSLKGCRFLSSLAADTGSKIRLLGKEDASLVFQRRPVRAFRAEDGNVQTVTALYLGICGHFSPDPGETDLLCGISGTETLKVGKDSEIFFTPDMPGVLPYEAPSLGMSSWTGISGNVAYYCQPEGSPLFAEVRRGDIRFLEIPDRKFQGDMPAVPLLPFRDVHMFPQVQEELWEKEIYSVRRGILSGNADHGLQFRSASGEESVTAVSPQGMILLTDGNRQFAWVGFARVSPGRGFPELKFNSVNSRLKQQLMQKEMICVIGTKAEMEDYAPSPEFDLTVDGMKFMLTPENWITEKGSGNTMLILKYSDSQSIRQALSGLEVFDTVMGKAYTEKGEVREGYERFHQAVETPGFQGILALNVPVSLKELPAEVKILTKEILPEDFCASFLILQTGKICRGSEQELCMEQAEIHALVDYSTDKKLVYDTAPPQFDYLTREIKIVTDRNQIRSFTSISELLVNCLFEAEAEAVDNVSGNCLILSGELVKEGGISKYQYCLKSETGFSLLGSGIRYVSVTAMDLTADGKGNGTFILGGVLKSQEIPGADLLGFGGEGDGEGLPFSALCVHMPEQGEMTMSYDRLRLDEEQAVWREGSFPDRFAVSLEQFTLLEEQPEALGWQSINTPVIQGLLQERCQGFRWKISLGDMGALAGGSILSMEFLTAFWCTDKKEPAYYIGVRLPDIMAGDAMLQGMLQIGFGSISLEIQDGAYLFRLHNYSVRLLGMSVPPGNSDLFLFSDGNSVGWYGAYTEE